jgi:Ca2+-binding RTX toxin-like protein
MGLREEWTVGGLSAEDNVFRLPDGKILRIKSDNGYPFPITAEVYTQSGTLISSTQLGQSAIGFNHRLYERDDGTLFLVTDYNSALAVIDLSIASDGTVSSESHVLGAMGGLTASVYHDYTHVVRALPNGSTEIIHWNRSYENSSIDFQTVNSDWSAQSFSQIALSYSSGNVLEFVDFAGNDLIVAASKSYGDNEIKVRIFNNSGVHVGEVSLQTAPYVRPELSVTPMANGDLLFAMVQDTATRHHAYFITNSAGQIKVHAQAFLPDASAQIHEGGPHLLLQDGRVLLVYSRSQSGDIDDKSYAQIIRSDGLLGGTVTFGKGEIVTDVQEHMDGRIFCMVQNAVDAPERPNGIVEIFGDGSVSSFLFTHSLYDRSSEIVGFDGDTILVKSFDRLTSLDLTQTTGTNGNEIWGGGNSSDKLSGFGGDDILIGRGGADFIDGGDGRDTSSYKFDDGVTVSLDGTFAATGAALGDQLISIENLTGSDAGGDTLAGDAGDNMLDGRDGTNFLYGRGGSDVLAGGFDADHFDGGEGVDMVTYARLGATFVDLSGINVADGGALGDTLVSIENIEGSATGFDRLYGDDGANELRGLGGGDYLSGRGGNDRLDGGDGDDALAGGAGTDTLIGGAGDDMADYYYQGAVTLALDKSKTSKGAAAYDTLISIENLGGSNTGNDTLIGNKKANYLAGNGGSDSLYGQAGNDNLDGGLGADHLYGGTGFDFTDYYYSKGVTVSLDGSLTATRAAKGDTFDSIEGIFGSATGPDKLSGDSHNNEIYGNGGHDKLFGRGGDDRLFGDFGADTLFGGDGYDVLLGGNGIDRLDGGGDIDVYAFDRAADGWDTIVKFEKDEEVAISKEGFSLTRFSKVIFQARNDNHAQDADDRLIFEKDARTLWFDSDGTGAAEAVKIAVFGNAFDLKWADIQLY